MELACKLRVCGAEDRAGGVGSRVWGALCTVWSLEPRPGDWESGSFQNVPKNKPCGVEPRFEPRVLEERWIGRESRGRECWGCQLRELALRREREAGAQLRGGERYPICFQTPQSAPPGWSVWSRGRGRPRPATHPMAARASRSAGACVPGCPSAPVALAASPSGQGERVLWAGVQPLGQGGRSPGLEFNPRDRAGGLLGWNSRSDGPFEYKQMPASFP